MLCFPPQNETPPTHNNRSRGAEGVCGFGERPCRSVSPSGRVGGLEPRQVVALFGAKALEEVPDRVLANYRRVFGFGDANKDGRYSKKEYVDDGLYLSRGSRQGIFRAADSDNDGFVTEAEYVENRVITDEAKEIFHDMDADGDGRLTAGEL